jgi:hypothetical protein
MVEITGGRVPTQIGLAGDSIEASRWMGDSLEFSTLVRGTLQGKTRDAADDSPPARRIFSRIAGFLMEEFCRLVRSSDRSGYTTSLSRPK